MKPYRLLLFCLGIALLTASGASTLQAENLSGAIRKALNYHPRSKAAAAAAQARYYESQEVRGDRLPSFSVSGSTGPEYRDRNVIGLNAGNWLMQREARATIRQRLFDFGLSLNDYKAAQKRAEVAEILEQDIDEDLALMVANVYLDVLRAQEQVRLATQNAAAHRESLNIVQERVDAGRAQSGDATLVRARLKLSASSIDVRQGFLDNASIRYRELVGENPGHLEPVGSPRIPSSAGSASLDNNPAWRASKLAYEAAELSIKAANGLGKPQFFIETNGQLGEDVAGVRGEDNEYSAFITASWDIYDGGSIKATKSRRTAEAQEALQLAREAQILAKSEFGRAFADRKSASASEIDLRQYSADIGQAVDAYEEGLELGNRAILNVLDIKNESFRARSSVVDAKYQKLLAAYRILASQGCLISTVAPGASGHGSGNLAEAKTDSNDNDIKDPLFADAEPALPVSSPSMEGVKVEFKNKPTSTTAKKKAQFSGAFAKLFGPSAKKTQDIPNSVDTDFVGEPMAAPVTEPDSFAVAEPVAEEPIAIATPEVEEVEQASVPTEEMGAERVDSSPSPHAATGLAKLFGTSPKKKQEIPNSVDTDSFAVAIPEVGEMRAVSVDRVASPPLVPANVVEEETAPLSVAAPIEVAVEEESAAETRAMLNATNSGKPSSRKNANSGALAALFGKKSQPRISNSVDAAEAAPEAEVPEFAIKDETKPAYSARPVAPIAVRVTVAEESSDKPENIEKVASTSTSSKPTNIKFGKLFKSSRKAPVNTIENSVDYGQDASDEKVESSPRAVATPVAATAAEESTDSPLVATLAE